MATVGRLDTLRVIDPILTTIARGYSNADFIGEEIFPIVPVDKEAGKIPTFGKEHFLIWETLRALRADSNEMEGGYLETIPFKTEEHDLVQKLDYRESQEAMLQLETRAVNSVMTAIALKREKMYADLAFNLDTYETTNKVTLTSNYFDNDNTDIVKELTEYSDALSSLIGKRPNTLLLGDGVWKGIKFNAKLKSYLGVSVSGNELFNIKATTQKLQEILEIEKVLIGTSKYSEDAKTFKNIWGNGIFLGYISNPTPLERTPYDPCFGYTLRKKGNPFSDKWQEQNGKITKVRTTDNFDIKVVGSESGFYIQNPIDPSNYSE